MPKINRTKLLEYLENEFAEELELSHILRCCEVQGYETHKIKNHERQQKEENKDFVPILPRITFLLTRGV